MHMFHEIVLTMQLVHLNCSKGPVQPPTRKEGKDFFLRPSDDNSINMNMKLPGSNTPSKSGRSTSKDEDHHGYER